MKKTTTRKNNNLPTFKLCLNDQAGKKNQQQTQDNISVLCEAY